jgi:hypothetical protein
MKGPVSRVKVDGTSLDATIWQIYVEVHDAEGNVAGLGR